MPTPNEPLVLDHLYRPANSSGPHAAPALFLLHGYGSHKDDLFSFANYLPPHFGVVALNAPFPLPFGGFAWYALEFTAQMERLSNWEQARESLRLLKWNIDHFCKRYTLDSKNVTLMGFSQGAILSWALGLDAPDTVHHVIGLSGAIDPELLKNPIDTYRNVTAFASHGTEDATIPVAYPRKTIGALEQNNPKVTYKEYPAGHTIHQDNFSDMLQWLNVYLPEG